MKFSIYCRTQITSTVIVGVGRPNPKLYERRLAVRESKKKKIDAWSSVIANNTNTAAGVCIVLFDAISAPFKAVVISLYPNPL